ncbi:MarR family winged helix-turn-helix transcriptional regulator [Dactylosporangium sp. NPDC051541]|uniref:MarR family winged helix-turn-helix transcriptional regulator n=1 Tax=Dactylosporangium sp. NPDC051541 TaxID=3363977 RepID=UPI0037B4FC85
MGWLNPLEFRAWIGYRRMRLLLDAEMARDLARTSGLSTPDYDVLSNLADAEDNRRRLTALAARMQWSKSRLSRHIGRMEERGLVTRRGGDTDGRATEVVLTDAGHRTIAAAAPDHVAWVRRHFVDLLSPEQLRVLGDVADIVLANLPPPAEEPPAD